MDERLVRTISALKNWEEIRNFEVNARAKNRFSHEVAERLRLRSLELAKEFISDKTGLDLSNLSPAEEKIIEAVGEYVAIMKQKGKYPSRTLEQLKNRGLISAAENSVSRATPTLGYQSLADESKDDLSYEHIITKYPEEFTPRAVWYARRTLKLPNDSEKPPADISSDVQSRTLTIIEWLRHQARENAGVIPAFTNADTAAQLGMHDLQQYGRVLGNIQSRIDFACYRCGLPPLGLAATAPFDQAWSQGDLDWAFPVASMQSSAQLRNWSDMDFDQVLRAVESLPGQAHLSWDEEFRAHSQSIKKWAYSFGSDQSESELPEVNDIKRNPIWTRDELILALDLYLRHRKSPPAKDSDEIKELSEFLNQIGRALGVAESSTYRNPNGVYMKLMNFMHRDPEYIEDGRVGLTRGNKDEEAVWDQFASDPSRLSEVVAAIHKAVSEHTTDHILEGEDDPDIQEAEEGRVLTKLHRYRERDRKIATARKNLALKQTGRLECEACGFDFSQKYGPSAKEIIDVHHTKPVHTLLPGEKTTLGDLALLCANCHRVVHSRKKWLTLDQVRALLEENK